MSIIGFRQSCDVLFINRGFYDMFYLACIYGVYHCTYLYSPYILDRIKKGVGIIKPEHLYTCNNNIIIVGGQNLTQGKD